MVRSTSTAALAMTVRCCVHLQAMQEFTDLEFNWNQERAVLATQTHQLRQELAQARAATGASSDKQCASPRPPSRDTGEEQQQALATRVAVLEQEAAAMRGG
jgi:hypothetical protein